MPSDAVVDTTMAAIAEAQFMIADVVGAEDGQPLNAFIRQITPALMKVADMYGDTHGKLSKDLAHLLQFSLKAVLMLLQSDTDAASLREACAGGGSRFSTTDDKLHSGYIEALVDLIPSVCDVELQLIAVEVCFNICARDADTQQLFLRLLGGDSNYRPNLVKVFKSINGENVESGCQRFVREMHKPSNSKYKVRGEKQMHIWDVQSAMDDSAEQNEVSFVLSNEEVYVTNLL